MHNPFKSLEKDQSLRSRLKKAKTREIRSAGQPAPG